MSNASRQTSRGAALSLGANAGLAVMKLVMGVVTGSLSVLADGVNSAGDVLTSLLVWYAIHQAHRSPDRDHGYGHGKFESLASAIEAVIIMATAAAVGWAALQRLVSGRHNEIASALGLIVMAVSATVNLLVSLHLERLARQHDSLALRTEALHRRVDVWTSGGVLLGLAAIALTGRVVLDPIIALAISLLILAQAFGLGREAAGQLLDRTLPPDEMEFLHQVLHRYRDLFVGYHRLRARKAGRERHVDLHLVVCAEVTVQEAHEVTEQLEATIRQRWPGTRTTIHVEPSVHGRGCHPRERSRLLGTRPSTPSPRSQNPT